MGNQYTADDLVTLSAGEGYRQKLGMYLSADKQEAINLGLRELIVNAQDEYEVYKPKGATVKITLDTKNRVISVEDNLRGIPIGEREDGVNTLAAAFLLPHSGAKHEEGAYSSAVGVNGQGNKIVCHTAEWLKVVVKREGFAHSLGFKSEAKGAFISEPLTKTPLTNKKETGTLITYKPDPRVYGDISVDLAQLREMLTEMSLFAKGLKILLKVDDREEAFFSKNGLIDGLKNEKAISKPFSLSYRTDECEVELALQWVQKNGLVKGYANGLYMPDGGAFMTAFKTAITRQFNLIAGKKFDGERIRNCLSGYCSVKVRVGQFTNQQKTALANTETREPVSQTVAKILSDFQKEQKNALESIIKLLSQLDKAEAAADRARNSILQSSKEIEKNSRRKVFASDKLKDATKLGQESTLLICEGSSAIGSLTQARDYTKYGLLEIRGKIINALSNPIEKVMENEEVKLIFSALGIVPNKYKASKLRYGRIGIASDSDSDGNHIALLLLAFFSELCPELLEEGRIFRLESPTHIVIKGNKNHYFFSSEEFQSRSVDGSVVLIKGLGEMRADQMRESMFGADQRLVPFKWSKGNDNFLRSLMGSEVEPRKEYLFNSVDFSKITE